MEEQLDIHLLNLQKKIQLLIKQNQILVKENSNLKNELKTLQTILKSKNNLTEELQQRIDVLTLNYGAFDEHEKRQLEKRLNEYLKDIEKCLFLLNV
jgi:hypothetical protein